MATPQTSPTPPPRISRQIILPWKKSVEITFKNFRVRFLRSLITVLSLVLAVAFVGYVFLNNDIASGYLETGEEAASVLSAAGYDIAPDEAGRPSIDQSPKERWILFLSLLVCTVGIVNAQLMSVTERFREIGVLKCLGALDRIILRLFVLEAVFMGVAGGVGGVLLGGLFALMTGLVRFGFAALTHLSLAGALGSMLAALGIGVGLSVAGVLYPALVAARMRPVEAMRAEY